jgi:hypothetical protein
MHKKVTPVSERRIKVRFLNLTLSLPLGYVACKVIAHNTMCSSTILTKAQRWGHPILGLNLQI